MGSSLLPSCFRSGGREGAGVTTAQNQKQAKPSPPTMAAPTCTTSVYESPYGFAALTWSRSSLLGISLRVDLRVPLPSDLHHHQLLSSPSSSTTDHLPYPLTSLRFRLRPFLPWRRRGSRRFRFRHPPRTVDFAWDLSQAIFPPGGSPEPQSCFSLSASLDGDLLLAAGDRVQSDPNPFLLASRTEHVVVPNSSSSASYTSTVVTGSGLERVVSLDLPAGAGEKDARMAVSIDGKKVLQVKRLRWKFRGSERVEVESIGGGALVSWDVHGWVFPGRTEGLPAGVEEAPAGANAELGWAVVVVRFDGTAESAGAGCRGGKGVWGLHGIVGCENCGEDRRKEGWRRRRSLLKTRSSSSLSSASSAGSSVMGWTSAEENDLRESEGFTFVFYLWRG